RCLQLLASLLTLCFGPRLLDDAHLALGIVGDAEDGEVLDLWLHAVALDDALAPGAAVERLGVLQRLPLVDAAGNSGLAPDEMLADEAGRLPEARSDLLIVVATGRAVDVRGQAIADDGGDHRRIS